MPFGSPVDPAVRAAVADIGVPPPVQSTREQLLARLGEYRTIGAKKETRRHRIARLGLTAALEALDLEAVDRLRDSSDRELTEGRRWLSYFALADHLVRLAGVAAKLRLDERAPSRILDLGSGSGLFGFLCRAVLGHQVVGVELPEAERPVNHALSGLLGVPLVEARLAPCRPLPTLPGRFDIVTALSPQFHRIDRHRFWSPEDWAWFIGHLARDVTGPEGAFLLKINRDKQVKGGLYRHDDFFAFAREAGARVDEHTGIVRFERLGDVRPPRD